MLYGSSRRVPLITPAQCGFTPLTFSIATGLSRGLLSFTFVKLGTGRHREISPLIWVLALLFVLRYAFLGAE